MDHVTLNLINTPISAVLTDTDRAFATKWCARILIYEG